VVPLRKWLEMVTPVFLVLPVTMCWRPMREVLGVGVRFFCSELRPLLAEFRLLTVTWLIQTFELPSRAMAR
jgi:hypothetical protein